MEFPVTDLLSKLEGVDRGGGGMGIEGAGSGGGRGGKWGRGGREARIEGAGSGGIGGRKSVTIWVRNCFCFIKSS